jgi:hypothetical protein
MDNSKLDDIAVLTTLARLHKNNMLAEADRKALEGLLSDWGKKAAQEIFRAAPSQARDIIQQYSYI